ncbi:hypothetical protein IscW_ISCW010805, partial [Ixodes scapularis]
LALLRVALGLRGGGSPARRPEGMALEVLPSWCCLKVRSLESIKDEIQWTHVEAPSGLIGSRHCLGTKLLTGSECSDPGTGLIQAHDRNHKCC